MVVNSVPTASLSRRRENARRRLATLSTLPSVISGSATRRSSFAFGRVVLMSSCLISDAAMLVNMAWRWALVRLNLRPAFWWRMAMIPGCECWTVEVRCRHPGVVEWTACGPDRSSLTGIAAGLQARRRVLHPVGLRRQGSCAGSAEHAVAGDTDRRPVLQLHAQRKATLREDFLDLGERLLAQVRGLEQLDLGLLDQVADVVDALGLEAVGRTHRQLQIVDRTQQDRVDARRLHLLAAAIAVGEVAEHRQLLGEDVGGGAHGFLGIDRAVGLDVDHQLVEVGTLFDARGFDFIGHATHRRERGVKHQPADGTGFLVRTATGGSRLVAEAALD